MSLQHQSDLLLKKHLNTCIYTERTCISHRNYSLKCALAVYQLQVTFPWRFRSMFQWGIAFIWMGNALKVSLESTPKTYALYHQSWKLLANLKIKAGSLLHLRSKPWVPHPNPHLEIEQWPVDTYLGGVQLRGTMKTGREVPHVGKSSEITGVPSLVNIKHQKAMENHHW